MPTNDPRYWTRHGRSVITAAPHCTVSEDAARPPSSSRGAAARGPVLLFFFFNDTATPEISPLSLHDALPICPVQLAARLNHQRKVPLPGQPLHRATQVDRKSTRLNSSHANISYAVFCLN